MTFGGGKKKEGRGRCIRGRADVDRGFRRVGVAVRCRAVYGGRGVLGLVEESGRVRPTCTGSFGRSCADLRRWLWWPRIGSGGYSGGTCPSLRSTGDLRSSSAQRVVFVLGSAF